MLQVKAVIPQDIQTTWNGYNQPEDIQEWNAASPDWHCPNAINDVQVGGKFCHTMAAKDGSFSFDFSGTYNQVDEPRALAYTLDDGRKVWVKFKENAPHETEVLVSFEAEQMNPEAMQEAGWQAILNNFSKYMSTK